MQYFQKYEIEKIPKMWLTVFYYIERSAVDQMKNIDVIYYVWTDITGHP